MHHGSFLARSHRTRLTLRATVRYFNRLEHLSAIQNVFLLAAFHPDSPLSLLALRLARLRWSLGGCAGRGSGHPALRPYAPTAIQAPQPVIRRSSMLAVSATLSYADGARTRHPAEEVAGHRAPPGFQPSRCARVKSSSAVVPTACKSGLMESRLAVGFSLENQPRFRRDWLITRFGSEKIIENMRRKQAREHHLERDSNRPFGNKV